MQKQLMQFGPKSFSDAFCT